MTETIWKTSFKIGDEAVVEVTEGAIPLCVQMQGAMACIWWKVDPNAKPWKKLINIYGTGHEHDAIVGKYIGTVQQGPFVWHVFDAVPHE